MGKRMIIDKLEKEDEGLLETENWVNCKNLLAKLNLLSLVDPEEPVEFDDLKTNLPLLSSLVSHLRKVSFFKSINEVKWNLLNLCIL